MIIDRQKVEKKALLNLVDFKGKTVLEIGCSNGRVTEYYVDLANFVLGIDKEINLNEVSNKLKLKNVQFMQGNFLTQGFNQKFDVIVFSMSLHHMGNYDKALEKAYSLLEFGGELVIIEPTINEYLNFLMSIFTDERKQIGDAYTSILKYKMFKREEIAILWEFENIEDLFDWIKKDNELVELTQKQIDSILSFVSKFKSDDKINLIDIWKFILIKKLN